MSLDLSSLDLAILIEAVESWEHAHDTGELMGEMLVSAMARSKEERDDLIREREYETSAMSSSSTDLDSPGPPLPSNRASLAHRWGEATTAPAGAS
jgi:hypothetical protein